MEKITVIILIYNEKENIYEMINILEKYILPQIKNGL